MSSACACHSRGMRKKECLFLAAVILSLLGLVWFLLLLSLVMWRDNQVLELLRVRCSAALNSKPYKQSTRCGFACFTTAVCASYEDDA